MRMDATPQAASAPADTTTGSGAPAPTAAPLSDEETRKRAEFSRRVAASFGHIVGVMMRSAAHKQMPIADLEARVMPALSTGQFRIAEAVSKETGFLAPAGFVLWAFVSPAVDARLSTGLDQPPRLEPQDWKSGDIAWLVEAVGDARAVMGLIQHLKATELTDRPVKMRIKGTDGKPAVGIVDLKQRADGDPMAAPAADPTAGPTGTPSA